MLSGSIFAFFFLYEVGSAEAVYQKQEAEQEAKTAHSVSPRAGLIHGLSEVE